MDAHPPISRKREAIRKKYMKRKQNDNGVLLIFSIKSSVNLWFADLRLFFGTFPYTELNFQIKLEKFRG